MNNPSELRMLVGEVLEQKVNIVLNRMIEQGLLEELRKVVLKEIQANSNMRDRKIDAILKIADGIKEYLEL